MHAIRPLSTLLVTLLMGSAMAHAGSAHPEWACKPAASGSGWDCGDPATPAYRLHPATSSTAVTPSPPAPVAAAPVTPASATQPAVTAAPVATQSPASPAASPATAPATAAALSVAPITPQAAPTPAELDWVPRDKLPAGLVDAAHECCHGAYVDPLANVNKGSNDPDKKPLSVSADSGVMDEDSGRMVMKGGIVFTQGYRQGHSDEAVIYRDENRVTLEGHVEMREPDLLVRADSADFHTGAGIGTANNVYFIGHKNRIRGHAGELSRTGDGAYALSDTSYTTCEPDSNAWDMTASDVTLDQNTGIGTAKNAVLHIDDVPLVYIPYLQFPIDSRRMTGMLWPAMGQSGRSGFEIAAPIYLNLAPNYDLTLTPRYLEKRGGLLEGEGRYLGDFGEWTLGGAYIGNDAKYSSDIQHAYTNAGLAAPQVDNERWLLNLTEKGKIGESWRTRVDYTRVSDDNYFRDLDPIGIQTQRRLNLDQAAEIAYTSDLWSFTGTAQSYQHIALTGTEPYAQLPHLVLDKRTSGEAFQPDWLLSADYSYFASETKFRGQRFYAEPGLTFPMEWTAGFLQPTVKLRQVSYAMAESNKRAALDPAYIAPPAGTDITGNPSATVPLFSLDGGLYFERNMSWASNDYTQTLEPRFYYLYAGYKNQDKLPNFDTSLASFNYQRMFRDSRFTGFDRLGDANQTAVGVTTRFIDEKTGREQLSFGLGQVFYFQDRRVNTTPGVIDTTQYSEIAGYSAFTPTETFAMITDLSWDPLLNQVTEGGLQAQWAPDTRAVFNAGYRYRRVGSALLAGSCLLGPGIPSAWDPTCHYTNEDVNQAELSAIVPLTPQWRLFAQAHYDLSNHLPIQNLGGLEYENCCWKARVVYVDAIKGAIDLDNNGFVSDNELKRDYAFYFQLQLKGLGDLADKLDTLLENNIPGFARMNGKKQ